MPPEAATREAKSITATSAVLRGELNFAAGEPGSYKFVYQQDTSKECNEEFAAPRTFGVSTAALDQEVNADVTNLQPDREYAFCVVLFNQAGQEARGSAATFKTLAPRPAVVRESSSVSSPGEATLEAVVNPENQATSCVFEYGKSTAYGTKVSCGSLEGFSEQGVGATASQLAPGATYHYRVVLENASNEKTAGSDGQFTTKLRHPIIESESEHTSSVGATSATLEASLDPNFQGTTYSFEYSSKGTAAVKGTAGSLQAPITTIEGSPVLYGGAGQPVGVPTGTVLSPGTTYYYRVTAENETNKGKPVVGVVKSFTTLPVPQTDPVTAMTATTATFNGHFGPLNENTATQYYFLYNIGPTCGGAGNTEAEEAGKGSEPEVKEAKPVTELQPNAEYTVCLVTVNEFGSQQGPPVHFRTAVAAPKIDAVSVPETPAVTLTPFEAKFEAQINANGQETTYAFEYSETESGTGELTGTITTIKGANLPAALGDQTASVLSSPGHLLTPATTYYYRVTSKNVTGSALIEAARSFTTPTAKAPVIEGESASNFTLTGATIEAQVNPEYKETQYAFEYAPHESELLKHEGTSLGGGTILAGSIAAPSTHLVSTSLSGLQPNTRYYYRVVAKNPTGPALQEGTVASFMTANMPTATTGAVLSVTSTTATVAGTLNPDGLPTSYYIQYGGVNYGQQTPTQNVPASTGPLGETITLQGLEPGVTYHYRLVANNVNGINQTAFGEDATFTTTATPVALTGLAVSGVTQTSATISATLEARGLPTRYELDLGSTPGQLQPRASGETSSASAVPITLTVESLSPSTTYYYKLIAANPDGPIEPPEGSFTTAAASAASAPAGLPAAVPFQSIAELNAREAKEAKKLPNPTTPLTNAQKLKKALKQCKKQKSKSKRAKCEKAAHKKYPTVKKKK